jgi:4-amino-4-deoxy-L-arabinose transferase-like glycosyltransferase
MAKNHTFNSLILFGLALTLRMVIIAYHGSDGLYGQDGFAYYDFAQDILYFMETFNPPPPFFWSVGYPMQLTIGFSMFGVSESVALGVSIGMGALIPVLVYGLAIQFKLRSPYAFLAGLLMAFSGQALQSSLVIMSDVPALFWATLSMLALLRYTESSKRRWLILCAFSVSFACLSRWIYLILPPLYLIAVLRTWKRHIRWIDGLLAIIFGLIPAIPQIAYNQINPTPLLNHSWVEGWSPLNAIRQHFTNIDGMFHYEKINALFYAYPVYDLSYLSQLLTIFVFIGCIALVRQRQWRMTILLLGWLILPFLFLVGIPYQNIRFALIIFPAVAILMGYGLQAIISIQHSIRWVFVVLCLSGLLHTAINGFDYANSFVEHHQSEKEIITWLDGKIPDNATLYTFGSTLTLEHYTDYSIIEIFYESPNTLKQRWFKGRTDYLLLNIWQIENQWQGRNPQANYHWFRDERGLTIIDRFHNLTLFEVNE